MSTKPKAKTQAYKVNRKVAELIRNHINALPVEVKQDLGYYRYHMQAN